MIKKIIVFIVSVGWLVQGFSQNNNNNTASGTIPVARATEKGIWVYLGNQLPKKMSYQVERKQEGSDRYEVIGKTNYPASYTDMETRYRQWYPFFDKLDPFDKVELSRIWGYLQRNQTTDSLISANLPLMHLLGGTAFLDTNTENNRSYAYRITRLGADNKVVNTSETPVVSAQVKNRLPGIRFSENKYADGKMVMEWEVKDPMDMAHFNIYRSVFGKNEFEKIRVEKGIYHKKDSLVLLAIDAIGKEPAWYEYMLQPVDIYGNAGEQTGYCAGGNMQSYYAPSVSGLKASGTQKDHEILLRWHYEHKKYLTGISIMRSMLFDSGYQRIATVQPADTSFTDIVPVGSESYYYYLLLYSAESKPVATAKVAALYTGSLEKPEPPYELEGETIKNGVKLYWKSEGAYVTGFFVYRQEHTDEGFVQVSNLIPAGAAFYSFIDSSKTLKGTEVYSYAVRSISDNDQMSTFSDTVTLHPGIAARLAAPMHIRCAISNNKVSIMWDDLRRVESNLLGYNVYRRSAAEKQFGRISYDSLSPGKNYFIDSSAVEGTSYEYAVSAFDFFGNESGLSVPVKAMIAESLPATPAGIKASAADNAVYISWGQLAGEEITAVHVYRSEPGQPAKMIETVKADIQEFTDKAALKGKLYFYQLSSVNKKNKESVLSEKISVRL